jgi:hypothetical protein
MDKQLPKCVLGHPYNKENSEKTVLDQFFGYVIWRNQRIGLCKNSLKIPPDYGKIIDEMRIGTSL